MKVVLIAPVSETWQAELAAVDPRIESPDLGDDFGPERIDLRREAGIDPVDRLGETDNPLVQDSDIATERMKLRRHDILKCFLDLIVRAHGVIQSNAASLVNVPLISDTPRSRAL